MPMAVGFLVAALSISSQFRPMGRFWDGCVKKAWDETPLVVPPSLWQTLRSLPAMVVLPLRGLERPVGR
jgi:hypothetical protein